MKDFLCSMQRLKAFISAVSQPYEPPQSPAAVPEAGMAEAGGAEAGAGHSSSALAAAAIPEGKDGQEGQDRKRKKHEGQEGQEGQDATKSCPAPTSCSRGSIVVASSINQDLALPPAIAVAITLDESQRPVTLACGHVEAALPADSLISVSALAQSARAGAIRPARIEDDDVGEYTNGQFSLLIPLDAKWD